MSPLGPHPVRSLATLVAGVAMLTWTLLPNDAAGDGITVVPDTAFAIRPDRGTGAMYTLGDRIALELDVPTAGFLTVYDVMPNGGVQVVFPHAWDRDSFVPAGRVTIPDPSDRWHYRIGSPPGTECVVAVLAPHRYAPPVWLPDVRLGAEAATAPAEEVLARRADEVAPLNAKIVAGGEPAHAADCEPAHCRGCRAPMPSYVARTWIQVVPATSPPRRPG